MIKFLLRQGKKGKPKPPSQVGLKTMFDPGLPKRVADRFTKTMKPIMLREIHDAIKTRAQRSTGKLAKSFKFKESRTSVTRRLKSIEVYSEGNPYARIQNKGGIIRAKGLKKEGSKYLHFKAYSGKWVRAKKVKLPGLKYLKLAEQRLRPIAKEELKKTLKIEGMRMLKRSDVKKK